MEDSPQDFEIALRAFKKAGYEGEVHHCEDGEDAINYLLKKGQYESANHLLPSLIILDLNLPGADGVDVLKVIKNNEVLKRIPVVMLTTSSCCTDVERCYNAGANAFLTKSMDSAAFSKKMSALREFWFESNIMPIEESDAINLK